MQSQKCIWMECGYVEYKLCDRNFDCENCPFDKAIKQEKSITHSGKIASINFVTRDLVFTPNHIWLERKDDLVIVGIDDFAQSMFNKNCTICFPVIGEQLFKGKTFLWFVGSFGAIGFQSPLDGLVVWINEELKEKPFKFFEENSLNLELVRLKCDNFEDLKSYSSKNYEIQKIQDLNVIKEFLLKKFSYPNLSETLPDGGDIIKSYLNELSSQEYNQLLKLLFNKKYREN